MSYWDRVLGHSCGGADELLNQSVLQTLLCSEWDYLMTSASLNLLIKEFKHILGGKCQDD